MTLLGIAYAAEALAQDSAGGSGGATGLLNMGNPLFLMIAMLAIFYFLLIRPQQKKQKEHKDMLASIQKGDSIFTAGGIHGKVTGVTDTVITLEIADRVRVKINRSAVGGLLQRGEGVEKDSSSGSGSGKE
jgi:preprotein translocase subunit YajC